MSRAYLTAGDYRVVSVDASPSGVAYRVHTPITVWQEAGVLDAEYVDGDRVLLASKSFARLVDARKVSVDSDLALLWDGG